MSNIPLRNEEYLTALLAGEHERDVPSVLPHEKAAAQAIFDKGNEDFTTLIEHKKDVSGGDDWHDGAFRATDSEARVVSERMEAVAQFLGAIVVDYPAETEERATLGSRVTVKNGSFVYPVDIVGFRAGYPDGVVDAATEEEVSGITVDSPIGKVVMGATVGALLNYSQGSRRMTIEVVGIDQHSVRERFEMAAAETVLAAEASE